MYERFYQLRERPFALSPDPDYLYPSRVHREALNYLRYGIESHAGFVVITGEIGSGKTTLLQTLIRTLDGETTVARIVNTQLEPRELLETLMLDLGLDPTGKSKPVMLRDLAQHLVDQRLAGRLVLLVVDEAQNLSLAALEEIRMLSNLETEKSKLLQIILVGQPNLRDTLAAPELEQLRQRITVSYHLDALDAHEAEAYINHRLRHAAAGEPVVFPRDVTDAIHARARGIPRMVNVMCDATLVFGYAEEQRTIGRPLLDEVLAELESTGILCAEGAPPHGRAAPAVSAADAGVTPAGSGEAAARGTDLARLRELEERAATLAEREMVVTRREQELAAQKRILAEEYRLLRGRPRANDALAATAAVPVPADGRTPTEAIAPGGAYVYTRPAAPYTPLGADPQHEGFWAKLRRFLLGAPEPGLLR